MQKEEFAELKELILSRAAKFGEFTLSSGKRSDFYFDGKQVTLHPRGAYLTAKAILDILEKTDVEAFGGPTLGADPVVGSVILLSQSSKKPLNGFIVRKEPKKHGLARWVEGDLKKGTPVALFDDVTTTAGSILKAIKVVEEMGCTVKKVISLVDREEGAKEALSKYAFSPIFKKSELKS
jgi:orotate phosphoribosyltransferase